MNRLLTQEELSQSIEKDLEALREEDAELSILRRFHEKWIEIHAILNEKGRCREAEIATQELIDLHHSLVRH